MEYIMIMEDKNYKIELDKNKDIAISDLEQMLDNVINLCKMYNIEDDEILYEIVVDTCLEVKESE